MKSNNEDMWIRNKELQERLLKAADDFLGADETDEWEPFLFDIVQHFISLPDYQETMGKPFTEIFSYRVIVLRDLFKEVHAIKLEAEKLA